MATGGSDIYGGVAIEDNGGEDVGHGEIDQEYETIVVMDLGQKHAKKQDQDDNETENCLGYGDDVGEVIVITIVEPRCHCCRRLVAKRSFSVLTPF